ncbi:MAG: Rrf2 family transcriptional regulator [Candidatus Gottesmanbacteria bacterium]
MKLTRQEELSILIAAELAVHDGQRLSLTDIGAAHGVSSAYLKKIIRRLKTFGLVESKEGVGGGYVLAKPAIDITVLEILQAVGSTNDASELRGARVCPLQPDCLPQRIRQQIETTFLTYCGNVTLDQVIKKG